MEQTANTMPAATLGQYKGLAFTRRVRPVSEKPPWTRISAIWRVSMRPLCPPATPPPVGCVSRWISRAFWRGRPFRTAGWKR